MVNDNKVQITLKDLKERPLGVKPAESLGGMNPQGILKSVKETLAQVKEIVKVAESLGLDIKSFLPGKFKDTLDLGEKTDAPQLAPVNQIQAIKQMLIMSYGDITVGELLERLKDELGDKKISQIGKLD